MMQNLSSDRGALPGTGAGLEAPGEADHAGHHPHPISGDNGFIVMELQ